jgi:hypothetical protein
MRLQLGGNTMAGSLAWQRRFLPMITSLPRSRGEAKSGLALCGVLLVSTSAW